MDESSRANEWSAKTCGETRAKAPTEIWVQAGIEVRMEAGSNAATEIRSGPEAWGATESRRLRGKGAMSYSHGSGASHPRRLKTRASGPATRQPVSPHIMPQCPTGAAYSYYSAARRRRFVKSLLARVGASVPLVLASAWTQERQVSALAGLWNRRTSGTLAPTFSSDHPLRASGGRACSMWKEGYCPRGVSPASGCAGTRTWPSDRYR